MRSDAELRDFFKRELLPELRAYERRRKETLSRLRPGITVALAVAGALAAWWLRHPAPLMIPVAFWILHSVKIHAEIRRDLKRSLVARVIRFWDPTLEYHPEGFVPESEFRKSGLFPGKWNRYGGEDLVRGTIGSTRCHFSELKVRRAHKKNEPREVFSGLFLVADFSKTFCGKTMLLPDAAERTFGVFGRALQGLRSLGGASHVALEDPEFERLFSVYTTDPVEARYLLSPSLMSRIVRFRKESGSELRIGFADECLYLAMPLARNLFDFDPTRSAITEEGMRAWIADLEFATEVIGALDLDTRIWSKPPPAQARAQTA